MVSAGYADEKFDAGHIKALETIGVTTGKKNVGGHVSPGRFGMIHAAERSAPAYFLVRPTAAIWATSRVMKISAKNLTALATAPATSVKADTLFCTYQLLVECASC